MVILETVFFFSLSEQHITKTSIHNCNLNYSTIPIIRYVWQSIINESKESWEWVSLLSKKWTMHRSKLWPHKTFEPPSILVGIIITAAYLAHPVSHQKKISFLYYAPSSFRNQTKTLPAFSSFSECSQIK